MSRGEHDAAEAILTFSDVTVRYPSRPEPAVQDVTLSVPRGEITMIVGESGSGKSTLLRAAAGLLPEGAAVEGNILFEGEDLSKMPVRKLREKRGAQLGVVFQDAGLYLDPRRKIGSQYAEAIRAHRKMTKKEAFELAEEGITRLALSDPGRILDSYPFELSGGMKQRTAIAMAMSLSPSLLLADEPTSALDVTTGAQVAGIFRTLSEGQGTSVLMVTHNIGLAAAIGDRIAVMYHGRLVEEGSRDAVICSPQAEYTRRLIEAVPKLDM